MKAIEFLKSQYIKDEIDNWKPESLDAMAAFMEAYHSHKNNGVFADVSGSLPDIYELGELNTKRIAAYRKFAEGYNVRESTIREAFCSGADWYKELITNEA